MTDHRADARPATEESVRHRLVKAVLLELFETEQERWPGILAVACEGEPEVRREVESLAAYLRTPGDGRRRQATPIGRAGDPSPAVEGQGTVPPRRGR